MCLTFHIRLLYFFGMLKKKSIYTKHVYFYIIFFPDLPNLAAQIRCTQNQCTFRESHVFLKVIPGVLGHLEILRQRFLLRRPVSSDYLSICSDYGKRVTMVSNNEARSKHFCSIFFPSLKTITKKVIFLICFIYTCLHSFALLYCLAGFCGNSRS